MNLTFSDNYREWEAAVSKHHNDGAVIVSGDDGAFRAYVAEHKVGCFGKLPGHGFYYKR